VDDRRNVVESMTRIGLIRRLDQGALGDVSVILGPSFESSNERRYYFHQLAEAFALWAVPDRQVVIELWDGDTKIGEYTDNDFFIGELYSIPR
jgi:hypothetical protein